jgi:hypothetical protein
MAARQGQEASVQYAHLPRFTSSVRVHDVIRERLNAKIAVPPASTCPDGVPLNVWARIENAEFHAQWKRMEDANRDAWASLGSEYVESSTA